MKIHLRFFIVILFLITALSCSSRHPSGKGNPTAPAPRPPGKVIANIPCLKDQAVSYSLYLPEGYSSNKKYPLMLVFDPHSKGDLPVDMYKNLAEKYGYILMGSNNSRNGLTQSETAGIVNALFEEFQEQYSVDTNRIYTLGFSGGGRVAGLTGLYRGGVAGVITCGAGLPATNQPATYKVDYFGIAGKGDYNMFELLQLDEQLEKAGFHHALVIYDGIHAWPPCDIMEDAFFWSDFCAMKESLAKKNDVQINRFISAKDSVLYALEKKGDLLAEYDNLKNILNFLEGLASTNKYAERLKTLNNNADLQIKRRGRKALMENELHQQQTYTENMFSKDLKWWRKEITGLDLRISNKKSSDDTLAARRMLSYLSLLAYMSSSRAIQSNDTAASIYALKIYEWADPDNPEVYYLGAVLAMNKHETEHAFLMLETAIRMGFNDKSRLQQQPEFESLKKEPEYSGLLQNIK